MKKILIAALALSAMSVSFASTMQSLNMQQAISTLSDKTITTISLVTLNHQLINNTATVYFGKDGKLAGKFATAPANAPQSDTGTWKVNADGAVCVTWTQWTQNQPNCVYTYKLADGVLFINQSSNNFESLVLNSNIQSGNQVN